MIILLSVLTFFSYAKLCEDRNSINPVLLQYRHDGVASQLDPRRVPCRDSVRTATAQLCGLQSGANNWTQFSLHASDPERSGSKRNELSLDKNINLIMVRL